MKMMRTVKILYLLSFSVLLLSCKEESGYLQVGNWRGAFNTQNVEIPFNFIVEDYTAGQVKVALINGAIRGQAVRFNSTSATQTVAGKWSVSLINEKNEIRYTVGLLEQDQSRVGGTILTTTGDYRYFDGVVDGDSLKISGFSGSNPSLLRAKIVDSLHLTGELISASGRTQFVAIKNDTAKLPDAYALTYPKAGYDKLDFTFPDLSGKPVSLQDEKYKDKVVVVTIMGSWCPNCVDEAAFLAPWYKENKARGVEIVALSFEHKDDLDFARARISKFVKRFDIEYDILFAGLADKTKASEKLPALNRVLSFSYHYTY